MRNPLGFWLKMDGNSMASRRADKVSDEVIRNSRFDPDIGRSLYLSNFKGSRFPRVTSLPKHRCQGEISRAIFGAHSNSLKLSVHIFIYIYIFTVIIFMYTSIYKYTYIECYVHRSIGAWYPPVIPRDIFVVQSVQSYLVSFGVTGLDVAVGYRCV